MMVLLLYPIYACNGSRGCNAPQEVELMQEYTGPVMEIKSSEALKKL